MLQQYLKVYSSVPMQNLVRHISFTEKWSERYYYFDENGRVHMKYAQLDPKSTEELLKNLKDCVAHNWPGSAVHHKGTLRLHLQ